MLEIPQQDFFNDNLEEKETLEEKFSRERLEWKEQIKNLSSKLKNVSNIPELMTEIYTQRQIASEYHRYLLSLLIGLNKKYRKDFDEKWQFFTYKSNIRYPNESSKTNRIQMELENLVIQRETINNHAKYIESTVQTIDNIIYAVQARLKAEDTIRGK